MSEPTRMPMRIPAPAAAQRSYVVTSAGHRPAASAVPVAAVVRPELLALSVAFTGVEA
ncbi:hypothetical protein [Streptomyces cadmiisoli]|uniref:hypothetical protein n=1 Tax=Streptomyces cadmiisoli TaxID=2184053 RepID=UPI0013A6AA0B|nr:hypothetical protein [Streptomyces cadmiisoli]